jgi:ABC-type transport system substrate-binding protein
MRYIAFLSIASVLALTTGGCAATAASPTTAPTAATTTDTFSGSVGQLGSDGHQFSVSVNGTVTVTLTALTPLTTMALGVGVGTWDGTACGVAISKNDNARTGVAALNGTAVAGNYCVLVYDSGNISDGLSESYTVQVAHP